MKNISTKSLGYPILLDNVIILMARVKGNLRAFLGYSYIGKQAHGPFGYGEYIAISLVIWLVVI
jgi:hypothetical protein